MNATIKKPTPSNELIELFNNMLNNIDNIPKDYVINFTKTQLKKLTTIIQDANIIIFINSILESYDVYQDELKYEKEQIELINDKKELAKLTKLIEKAPTKKELKEIQKNEYIAEINDLDFELSSETMALINDNLEISETMKQLRKKQLNNSKYIFMNINKELLNLKNSIDADKNLKHIEFTKKGIINLLRIKLNTKKMAKDLSSSLNISMDYLSYNLSLNLEFATINDIKSIIKAYELSINGVNEYKSITKNRIAKAKNEATVKDLLNEIKEANKKFKTNEDARIKEENDKKVIADYLANQDKKAS